MCRDFFKQRENALASQQEEKILKAFIVTGGTSDERQKRVNTLRLQYRAGFPHVFATSFGNDVEDAPDIISLIFSNRACDAGEITVEFINTLAVSQGNKINLSEEPIVLKAFLIKGATGDERVTKLFELKNSNEREGLSYAMVGCIGKMLEEEPLGLLVSNKVVSNIDYSKEFIVNLAVEQGNIIDLTPTHSLQCGQ